MSEHDVRLEWRLRTETFDYDLYNRSHSVDFDGTNRICASASPDYHGDPSCVNPEQAFIAALASCQLLTFLAIASRRGLLVISYTDHARGFLGRNDDGRTAIVRIVLQPSLIFDERHAPSSDEFFRLQDQAHRGCFIANSMATCVNVEIDGRFTVA